MNFEELAKDLIQKYEKRVVDYHYKGTVIYPEDALEMMKELYRMLKPKEEDKQTHN